jgi:hypothetical protein
MRNWLRRQTTLPGNTWEDSELIHRSHSRSRVRAGDLLLQGTWLLSLVLRPAHVGDGMHLADEGPARGPAVPVGDARGSAALSSEQLAEPDEALAPLIPVHHLLGCYVR